MSTVTTYGTFDLERPIRRPRGGAILLALSVIVSAVAGGFAIDHANQPTHAAAWSGSLPKDVAPMSSVAELVAPLAEQENASRFDRTNYDLLFGKSSQLSAFVRPQPELAPAPLLRETPPPAVALAVPPSREVTRENAGAATAVIPLPPANPFRTRSLAQVERPKDAAGKRTVATVIPVQPQEGNIFQKLFGSLTQGASTPALAYARTEEPSLRNSSPVFPRLPESTTANKTAVYDIDAKIVYMPNGEQLEAHSGLGPHFDDVRSVSIKNNGVTPPNVYDLTEREALFHGVRALRMTPQDNSKMYGRDGILAHSYMLGPRGDSNGCVSFKDYDKFLNAYLRGEVKRLVVVPSSGRAVAERIAQSRV